MEAQRLNRPLRICVLGTANSPHVVARARAFQARGHTVDLISPVPGDTGGMPTRWPPAVIRNGLLRRLWLVAWTAFNLLRTRADVFHAHYAAEVGTWLASVLRRRPLVISVMGGDVLFDEQGSLGPVGRWLTRRSVRTADFVTVKTPQLARVVEGFGVAPARCDVVIWGVDGDAFAYRPDRRDAFRRRHGIDGARPVVFSPRMLVPFYDIGLIVDAWPVVSAAVGDALLVLSTFRAEPAYREQLTARARELGIKNQIMFLPPLAAEEMAEAYCGADAVVSVPPSDGFPQTVLEAAAAGRPLILSDLPRLYGLLEPETDAIYAARTPDAIAAAIIRTLADPVATARRADNACRKVRAQADFRGCVDRVEAIFQTLARDA